MCPAVPATTYFIRLLFLLACGSLLPPASAQSQEGGKANTKAPESEFTFKSGVSNVRVDVQVLSGGQPVTDLTRDDFIVYDQDVSQQLLYGGRDGEQLSLLLVLDVSGSMRKYIEQVAAVARQSLRYLWSRDRVGIMVFAKTSRVRRDFTNHHFEVADEIKDAVWDETLGSGTSINDALLDAATYIDSKTSETGRKSVLIITDNLGLNYKSPDEPVIRALWGCDAVLNAIVVGRLLKPSPPRPGSQVNPDFTPPDVFRIAEETGGEAVTANKAGEAFDRMIERIRTRYVLQYRMPENANGFRNIRVELTPAAKMRYPTAEIRARKGYYANR
jgi:VWFA-related protein